MPFHPCCGFKVSGGFDAGTHFPTAKDPLFDAPINPLQNPRTIWFVGFPLIFRYLNDFINPSFSIFLTPSTLEGVIQTSSIRMTNENDQRDMLPRVPPRRQTSRVAQLHRCLIHGIHRGSIEGGGGEGRVVGHKYIYRARIQCCAMN